MIRFVLTKDYDDMSRKAANIIGAQVVGEGVHKQRVKHS